MARARGAAASAAGMTELAEAVQSIGARELRAIAAITSNTIARPAPGGGMRADAAGSVAAELGELRDLAGELASSAGGVVARPGRRFGILRAPDPVAAFAERSERWHRRIEEVLGALGEAQQALRSDSAAIQQEQVALSMQVEALRRDEMLLARLDERLASLQPPVPTELAFAVSQRRRDLLIQLAVGAQADAALRIVLANNTELVREIENAVTTTAAALSTSVMVRQALLTQRVVRRRIQNAREAQAAGVAGTALQVEALKAAWASVQATLSQVDTARAQGLQRSGETGAGGAGS